GTMTARWPKDKIISNDKIQPGDVIVGLASYGKATYESFYNSGIGSNGLTSARHDVLNKFYAEHFKETYEPSLKDEVVYIGKHRLTDKLTVDSKQLTVGELILSPTRTYAPVVKEILENHFDAVHGMIHSSGGGQTKCMKYVNDNIRIIKDNLFTPPVIFDIIKEASGSDDKEMYQVFNMGCRLEVYTNEKDADSIINISHKYGIEARIIGRVEESSKKELVIRNKEIIITF
ncbi:MAG: phosphoribosylformylglycinamidine cyclo-ligase, partial [Sphingobacteriales bacterium]|nr:phosphoribosylformylglycinamidine cyclo-ligase [Sphingobacteriales bacterium]